MEGRSKVDWKDLKAEPQNGPNWQILKEEKNDICKLICLRENLLARLFSRGLTNLSNSISVIAFTTSDPVMVFLGNIYCIRHQMSYLTYAYTYWISGQLNWHWTWHKAQRHWQPGNIFFEEKKSCTSSNKSIVEIGQKLVIYSWTLNHLGDGNICLL